MDDDSTVDDIFELVVLRQMMNTVEDCANITCNDSSVTQPKHGGSRPGRSSNLRRGHVMGHPLGGARLAQVTGHWLEEQLNLHPALPAVHGSCFPNSVILFFQTFATLEMVLTGSEVASSNRHQGRTVSPRTCPKLLPLLSLASTRATSSARSTCHRPPKRDRAGAAIVPDSTRRCDPGSESHALVVPGHKRRQEEAPRPVTDRC